MLALERPDLGPATLHRFPPRLRAAVREVLHIARHGQVLQPGELSTEQLSLLCSHRRQQLYQEATRQDACMWDCARAGSAPRPSDDGPEVQVWAMQHGWVPPDPRQLPQLRLQIAADALPGAGAGGSRHLSDPSAPQPGTSADATMAGRLLEAPPRGSARAMPRPSALAGGFQGLPPGVPPGLPPGLPPGMPPGVPPHLANMLAHHDDVRLLQHYEGGSYRNRREQSTRRRGPVAALKELERQLAGRLMAGVMPAPRLPTAPHPLRSLPKELVLRILQLAAYPLSVWAEGGDFELLEGEVQQQYMPGGALMSDGDDSGPDSDWEHDFCAIG